LSQALAIGHGSSGSPRPSIPTPEHPALKLTRLAEVIRISRHQYPPTEKKDTSPGQYPSSFWFMTAKKKVRDLKYYNS